MKKGKRISTEQKHDRLAAKYAGMRLIDIENHKVSMQYLKEIRETCLKEQNILELLAYLKKAYRRRLRLLMANSPESTLKSERDFEIFGYGFDPVFTEISDKLIEVDEKIKAAKHLPPALQKALVKDTTQQTDRGLSVEQKVLLIHFLDGINYAYPKSDEISETSFFKIMSLLLNRSAENIKKVYNNRKRNSKFNPFTTDNLETVIEIFKEVKSPAITGKIEKELNKCKGKSIDTES